MTTTLRVIIDQLTGPTPGGIGRYAEDLTSAIVASTPSGCEVEGVVSAVTPEQTADLERRLPGLARITRVPLPAASCPAPGSWASRRPALPAWSTRPASSRRCAATTASTRTTRSSPPSTTSTRGRTRRA
ncbi:hypothetical protein [Clavibacter michiganensis]|uniref:hypothetical protein n=1 Tax=Clavibacter michiganensis TaxID=28447 RepID=UPI001FB3F41E|nr:hypothetical protein [Clavibacter michiganensis]